MLEFRTQKQWHILRKERNTITLSGIHQLTAKTSVRKALGTRHKDVAQKMLKELQDLELLVKLICLHLVLIRRKHLKVEIPYL